MNKSPTTTLIWKMGHVRYNKQKLSFAINNQDQRTQVPFALNTLYIAASLKTQHVIDLQGEIKILWLLTTMYTWELNSLHVAGAP